MLEIFLLAIALAMDAFAVSVGICSRTNSPSRSDARFMVLSFAWFQAGMTLLGGYAGKMGSAWLESWDHWVAFALLGIIGLKMIWEGIQPKVESSISCSRLSIRTLLALSIATSIDAGAVGVSLALLEKGLWIPSLVIGLVTLLLCWAGVHFGRMLGARMGSTAEIIGGFMLWGIGLRTLMQHI